MGRIEYVDASWTPIAGCSQLSRGCARCWALAMARRQTRCREYAGLVTPQGWSGLVRLFPQRLGEPLRWRRPQRVAVGLMGDIGHERLSDGARCPCLRCASDRRGLRALADGWTLDGEAR